MANLSIFGTVNIWELRARAEGAATRTARGRPSLRGFGVLLHRRAGTDEVPVAPGVVDPAHRRPVLVDPERAGGEAALLARIGPVPLGHEILDRVRGAAQRALLGRHLA